MISGLYLGEIVRLILIDLSHTIQLFKNTSIQLLEVCYSFDTAFMSRIERSSHL